MMKIKLFATFTCLLVLSSFLPIPPVVETMPVKISRTASFNAGDAYLYGYDSNNELCEMPINSGINIFNLVVDTQFSIVVLPSESFYFKLIYGTGNSDFTIISPYEGIVGTTPQPTLESNNQLCVKFQLDFIQLIQSEHE